MAYVICNDENHVFKIAENDTQKDSMNVTYGLYEAKTITADQFNKLKKNRAVASISNNAAVVTDKDAQGFDTEEHLKSYHSNIIKAIDKFLDCNSTSNALYTPCQNYKQVLESFNYSSITPNAEGFYLFEKTWEEYCEENSITYLHILQIP